MTRVGTRVRNPLLGMPDAWEQQVLAEFAERAGKGETFPSMTRSEVVAEPDGQYYRFMKPIALQHTVCALSWTERSNSGKDSRCIEAAVSLRCGDGLQGRRVAGSGQYQAIDR